MCLFSPIVLVDVGRIQTYLVRDSNCTVNEECMSLLALDVNMKRLVAVFSVD